MSLKDKIVDFFIKKELQKEKYRPMFGKINSAWAWLEGKKSGIFAVLSGVAALANILGFINHDQLQAILLITGSGFAASMADKGNRAVGLLRDLKVLTPTVSSAGASALSMPSSAVAAPATASPSQPAS